MKPNGRPPAVAATFVTSSKTCSKKRRPTKTRNANRESRPRKNIWVAGTNANEGICHESLVCSAHLDVCETQGRGRRQIRGVGEHRLDQSRFRGAGICQGARAW